MDEYSGVFLLVVVIVAFIAGYAIVSFLVKKIRARLDETQTGSNQPFEKTKMQQNSNPERNQG